MKRSVVYKKTIGYALILYLLLGLGSACRLSRDSKTIEIVKNGSCAYKIVLQPGASPSERRAAEELNHYFKAATGVELPVVDSAVAGDSPMFLLGLGDKARALGVNPTPQSLGEQGFVQRVVGPHVVIAGTGAAGTLYGVHRFLEDHLGVRWYAPGVTRIPAVTDLKLPLLDRLVRPAFLWRHTSWNWPGKDAAFMAHQGGNSGSGGADHIYGIQHAHNGRAHSYFWYVSPDEFFATHPEYFSEIGGVRVKRETQLCLTNPEVLEIVTERMLKRMADYPQYRQYNFSQKDYYNYCTCDKCSAMNALYGTAGGTQYWFVNKLAERTSAVYPDKVIGTLAYMYTEEPPTGLRMHPNAAVWLCHMFPSCDSHPIATCPLNADFKRRAIAWSKLTDHLYMWHYNTNFTHYYEPFPNFRAMAADLKFYRDIGVEGIYLQGMGHSGGGGEFSLLRPYTGLKLLWDPDQDVDVIIRDFLKGYYGDAWAPIHEYMRMLHDKVEQDNVHMHLYTNPSMGYLTDPIVARAVALFDQAEKAVAGDAELLERVRVARMPLVYARLFPRNGYKIEDGKLKWQGEIAPFNEVNGFIDRMAAHGFKTLREVGGDTDTLMMMYLMFLSEPEVHTLQNAHLTVEVVPMLAGRALRITDRQSGKGITAYDVRKGMFFPFSGGLESRVGESFRFYGWVEPATVVSQSERSITIALDTFDGFKLERKMTLEPSSPVLHVETRVTNPFTSAKEVRLRSHLELNLGDLNTSRIKFTSLSGRQVDKDVSGIVTNLREGEHFYDQDAPNGAWTFSGSKGLKVTQRLDNSQVDFTWVYAYPDYLNDLEVEVWARQKVLAPGESVTLKQELEIRPYSP